MRIQGTNNALGNLNAGGNTADQSMQQGSFSRYSASGPGAAPRPIEFEDVQPPNLGVGLSRSVRPQAKQRGWGGLNQAFSDESRLENQSPNLQNVEGFSKRGALRTRRGLCKVDSGTPAAEGLCVCDLGLYINGVAQAALVSYDGSTNSTIEAVAVENAIKPSRPPHAAPTVTLSSPVAGQFRASVAATNMPGEIKRVLIKYDTVGFPESYFDEADLRSASVAGGSGNPLAWDGNSTINVNLPTTPDLSLTGTTFFVSVWALSELGASPAYRGRVEVS